MIKKSFKKSVLMKMDKKELEIEFIKDQIEFNKRIRIMQRDSFILNLMFSIFMFLIAIIIVGVLII